MKYTGYLTIPKEDTDNKAFEKYTYQVPIEIPTMNDTKDEIVEFCKLYELDFTGTKQELINNIELNTPSISYLPTWNEAFEKYRQWLSPREVTTSDGVFVVFKDEFSFQTGIVSHIYELGKNKPLGYWSLFTHSEILEWISENEVRDDYV